jgi:predicted nucleic acid-binding protein
LEGEKVKIYLDLCCLSRPFDDQEQARIHLESEAVLLTIDKIREENGIFVSSEALEVELENIPDANKQKLIKDLLQGMNSEYMKYTPKIIKRAKELCEFGIGSMDALHLSCAEMAQVDVFLSTDDKLVKIAKRKKALLKVRVENPIHWLQKQGGADENN